jgi:hypothetical protein
VGCGYFRPHFIDKETKKDRTVAYAYNPNYLGSREIRRIAVQGQLEQKDPISTNKS